jgi:hypothetical protein
MCVGLEIIGALIGAVGSLASAGAQASAAQAQAQQNDRNAIIAQRNAEDARQRSIPAQQDVQLRSRARVAMQKNIMSERSIDVASGSSLDILGDTAMFGKMDELTTRQNFEREAISHESQAMNFRAQADVDRMTAKNAMLTGGISAFSTALGGIGQATARRRMTL